jgi:hypothetical protein
MVWSSVPGLALVSSCEPYFDLALFREDWQGQVYDNFSSFSEEFMGSRLLLLRMVLVFLPMEPRWPFQAPPWRGQL